MFDSFQQQEKHHLTTKERKRRQCLHTRVHCIFFTKIAEFQRSAFPVLGNQKFPMVF